MTGRGLHRVRGAPSLGVVVAMVLVAVVLGVAMVLVAVVLGVAMVFLAVLGVTIVVEQ